MNTLAAIVAVLALAWLTRALVAAQLAEAAPAEGRRLPVAAWGWTAALLAAAAAALVASLGAHLPPALASGCVAVACGLAAWCWLGPVRALQRAMVAPWWRATIVRSLEILELDRCRNQPWLPLGLLGAAAVVGGLGWGLAGIVLALGASGLLLRTAAGLLARRAARAVERADALWAGLLPELATGIRRSEHLTSILDRLCRQTAEIDEVSGRPRYPALVNGLLHACTTASRLNPPVLRVCEVLSVSPVPGVRQTGAALRGIELGVDVPLALDQIARLTSEEIAFRREVEDKIARVSQDTAAKVGVAVLVAVMLTWRNPDMIETVLQGIPLCILGVGVAALCIAFAILHVTIKDLR